jgi:hypothetical protein
VTVKDYGGLTPRQAEALAAALRTAAKRASAWQEADRERRGLTFAANVTGSDVPPPVLRESHGVISFR